jgi:hypothetical protein
MRSLSPRQSFVSVERNVTPQFLTGHTDSRFWVILVRILKNVDVIYKLIRNKYAINFILIPIIFLIFIPTLLVKSLYFLSVFYDMIIVFIYPIFLSLLNYNYHKDKGSKKFVSNSYLMITATIINFIPYSIIAVVPYLRNNTPQNGEQFGFFIIYFASGLLVTFICGLLTYLSLLHRLKNRI